MVGIIRQTRWSFHFPSSVIPPMKSQRHGWLVRTNPNEINGIDEINPMLDST